MDRKTTHVLGCYGTSVGSLTVFCLSPWFRPVNLFRTPIGHVNVSPKGVAGTFKVIDSKTVMYQVGATPLNRAASYAERCISRIYLVPALVRGRGTKCFIAFELELVYHRDYCPPSREWAYHRHVPRVGRRAEDLSAFRNWCAFLGMKLISQFGMLTQCGYRIMA